MFDLALDVLKKAERMEVMDQKVIKKARAMINYEQAKLESDEFRKESYLEQANRLAPDITSVAVDYSKLLKHMDKIKRARKVLEAAWSAQPDISLLEEYIGLDPETDPKEVMKSANRLVGYNEHHPDGYLALAQLSIKMQEWGKARAALNAYQDVREADKEYCYLMARLELSQHADQTRYREWMERAIQLTKMPAQDVRLEDLL